MHDFRFAHGKMPPGLMVKCPLCADREIDNMRQLYEATLAQRDLLLAAIDLKRTLVKS